MPRSQRKVQAAVAVLLLIVFAVTAGALVLFSRSLDGIRGDFCAYVQAHYRATLELPQNAAREQAEQSDLELLAQLGCPQKGTP
jgi:hypothetical protein